MGIPQNVLSFALKHGSTFGAYMVTGKVLGLSMGTVELCKYSGIGAAVGILSHLAEFSPATDPGGGRCPGCSVETDLKVRKFLIRWVAGSFPFLTNSSYWKILGYSLLFSGASEIATEFLEHYICCRHREEISLPSISSSGSPQASAAESVGVSYSSFDDDQAAPISFIREKNQSISV